MPSEDPIGDIEKMMAQINAQVNRSFSEPRDPNRIPRILKEIERIWTKNPDLRLSQLISNCWHYKDDIFFGEDDILEERLKQVYPDE